MADPFTLSLIAANCAWGAAKGVSGLAATESAKKLIAALRAGRTPENHDVLAATHAAFVRSIQLMAEACENSAGDPKSHFVAKDLGKLARSTDFTTFSLSANELPKQDLDDRIRAIFEDGASDPALNAANGVIAWVEAGINEPLTETFRALFRKGSAKHPSWPDAFQLFFAEEVKEKPRVFRILTLDRLNELTAFAAANAEALAALHRQIAEFWQAVTARLDRIDDNSALARAQGEMTLAIVRELAASQQPKSDKASVELLASIAAHYRDAQPEADIGTIRAYLLGKIGEYHQLRERISTLEHEDNRDAVLLADANRALAEGDFAKADDLLSEAESLLDERIDRLLVRKAERRSLRGEAAKLKGDYETAIVHFDAAAAMLPHTAREARLSHSWSGASAATEWGERIEPAATVEAARRWKALITMIDRAVETKLWASLQNNLGNALSTMGGRQEGTEAFDEAVAAYRVALEVYTRENSPLDWAMTQNNLGATLSALSGRQDGIDALDAAVAAYRATLEVYTRNNAPLEWGTTQNNLGNALSRLGKRQGGIETLGLAVAAYRSALEVRTRENRPIQWAMTQHNLGTALSLLGERQEGTKALEQAVAAYRAALEVRDRENSPIQWAMTQNNLGNALSKLGERQEGTEALDQAVAAYRAALEVRTREKSPIQWAMTQNNLGNALSTLGGRQDGTEAIDQAVAAYRAALEVNTRVNSPFDWATTQENLGYALCSRARLSSDCATAREAVAALEAALEVFAHPSLAWNRAKAERGLAEAHSLYNELCDNG